MSFVRLSDRKVNYGNRLEGAVTCCAFNFTSFQLTLTTVKLKVSMYPILIVNVYLLFLRKKAALARSSKKRTNKLTAKLTPIGIASSIWPSPRVRSALGFTPCTPSFTRP